MVCELATVVLEAVLAVFPASTAVSGDSFAGAAAVVSCVSGVVGSSFGEALCLPSESILTSWAGLWMKQGDSENGRSKYLSTALSTSVDRT